MNINTLLPSTDAPIADRLDWSIKLFKLAQLQPLLNKKAGGGYTELSNITALILLEVALNLSPELSGEDSIKTAEEKLFLVGATNGNA